MSTVRAAVTRDEASSAPIDTAAGTGETGFSGDEGTARSARLNHPYGVAVDGVGPLYFSEYSNHRIRKVTAEGKVSTCAGTGFAHYGGDGGPAASAHLSYPRGVAVDSAGAVYVADTGNHRVRKIAADGTISTVAGTGTAGSGGDDGPAADAELNRPYGVAVDGSGVLYIAEYGSHRIRKVAADGTIGTFAGTGSAGFEGDGGPAVSARLNGPYAVAVDSTGAVYIADTGNHRVRKVAANATISTVAGTGTAGSGGDGGPAASAHLNCPAAVAVDGAGVLYIADQYNHRVQKVTADGTVSTCAGTGAPGFGGDGGPAASALLNNPFGLAADNDGALYIADHINNRVRKVAAPAVKPVELPASGTVVCWSNVRSRLRMGIHRESLKDGAEARQTLASPRSHQRWRLITTSPDDGEVLYRIENVRSGKVLEVAPDAHTAAGPSVVQRTYEGDDAHHQQWKLIPVATGSDAPQVYEIANHKSGLLLQAGSNAPIAVTQDGPAGDRRNRQWQMLPA